MNDIGTTRAPAPTITRFAAYGATAALASGVVAAVSTVFLLLTFATQASTMLEPPVELTPLDRTANGLMGLAVLVAIPVAFRLHQSWRTRAATASSVAMAVGVVSLLANGLLLLVHATSLFNWNVDVFTIVPFGGIGLWIFLVSGGRADPALDGVLRWVGLAIGVGYMLLVPAFYGGGGPAAVEDPSLVLESPILLIFGAMTSLLASQIGYPIWAIWLGRRLRASA